MLQSLLDGVGYNPIFFPPPEVDRGVDDDSRVTFADACNNAAESHRPLILRQDVMNLSETIVLRKRQRLTIVGEMASADASISLREVSEGQHPLSSERVKIAGKIHSLFLLNNHSELILRNLKLIHEDDGGEDCRKVGAAVNLRYKSKAWLENCNVASHAGFCCWAVQKASLNLNRCYLEAPLRSAVVCFGQSNLECRSCTITNVGVHGVCARGECNLRLEDSSILFSAVRGLYAYANANVHLNGCTISSTMRKDMAAIEVSSAEATTAIFCAIGENKNSNSNEAATNTRNETFEKRSSLMMTRCYVTDNAGVGIRIRGGVRHNLSSKNEYHNHFARNLGGNEVDFRVAGMEEESNGRVKALSHSKTTAANQSNDNRIRVQRDSAGSSFRKGDWWCYECVPKIIVQGSKDSCPRCSCSKSRGIILQSEEILKLNRSGIWAEHDPVALIVVPSTNKSVSGEIQMENTERQHEVVVNPATRSPTWWFDGDDAGWLPYDDESSKKLESAFQSHRCEKESSVRSLARREKIGDKDGPIQGGKLVSLSEGRYIVNVETMEQTNTTSQFLRLVQRRDNKNNN